MGKETKIIVVGDSGHGLTILIDASFRKYETLRTENLRDFRVHLSAYKRSRITEIQVDSKVKSENERRNENGIN